MVNETQTSVTENPLVKVSLGEPVVAGVTFPDTAIMTKVEAKKQKYPILGEVTPEEAENFQHPVAEKPVSELKP